VDRRRPQAIGSHRVPIVDRRRLPTSLPIAVRCRRLRHPIAASKHRLCRRLLRNDPLIEAGTAPVRAR
jgi:hypothetical protein